MGWRDALRILKLDLGFHYNKGNHKFEYNSNISEGQYKQISETEWIGVKKGKPIYCVLTGKDKRKRIICKSVPSRYFKK